MVSTKTPLNLKEKSQNLLNLNCHVIRYQQLKFIIIFIIRRRPPNTTAPFHMILRYTHF